MHKFIELIILLHIRQSAFNMEENTTVVVCHHNLTQRCMSCSQQCQSAIWLVELGSQVVDEATLLSHTVHRIYHPQFLLVSLSSHACTTV